MEYISAEEELANVVPNGRIKPQISVLRNKKHKPMPTRCAICNRECKYCYYSVRCCEGCKQFFRRAIALKKRWACQKDNNCSVLEGDRCKACRLNRCILVGMNWQLIGLPFADNDPYIVQLENLQVQLHGTTELEENQLANFLRLIAAQSRIMNAFTAFDYDYMANFNSLEDLIVSSENILGQSAKFSSDSPHYEKVDLLTCCARAKRLGHLPPDTAKVILVDRLICVGFAKNMPVFQKLSLEDKAALIRHVAVPVSILCSCFVSYELGAGTWLRKNYDFPMITFYQNSFYASDEKLIALANTLFTKSMEPMARTKVTKEEYALLLAISLSQSAIPNLSAKAKELLYAESVRYSKILFRHLQSRLRSPGAVAKCFQECISLIDQSYYTAHHYGMFKTYLDAFLHRQGVDIKVKIPECIKALF